jgi:hypothetical protein
VFDPDRQEDPMSESRAHQAPSARQLSYLKALAVRTGTSFAYPRTRAQASAEIERLRQLEALAAEREEPVCDERAPAYAAAVRPDEVSGYGASARWRHEPAPARRPAEDASVARNSDRARAAPQTRERAPAARLGSYAVPRNGELRELVRVAGAGGSTLVVDRRASDLGDARLVAHLAADEPPRNALIACVMYLGDRARGRCRRLSAEDLEHDPLAGSGSDGQAGAHADAPLRDADGRLYSIRQVSCNGSLPELRWTRSRAGKETFETLTLREVVGAFEDYEPARGITLESLRRQREDDSISTCRLRDELERVNESAIVLNRGLREAVERKVSSGELTMSEIARRCGRFKRDGGGSGAADTSWLARRVGLLPEGGEDTPTVWVHSDVLARIARDGLDVSPNEVELG